MNRKEWLIVLGPLVVAWGIDRITKAFVVGLESVHSYGILNFVLHHNHGAMLGLFSDLPPVLRIVSLSTGGAFLIVSYAIVQYLLPIKSLTLRSGMSVLLGGILGNVTDRIIWGYVVDFIVIGTPKMASPAFNMADALQWVGYIMIVIALVRESELLWPINNLRKTYWVNPAFQLRYCFILLGVGLGLALIVGTFSYTYLRVTILELVGHNFRILNQFLIPYVITLVMISFAFLAFLFMVGKILSHRTAGPLYAFEKFLGDLLAGNANGRKLKLRTGDDFQHLEEVAEKILVHIENLHSQNAKLIQEHEKKESH